MRAARTLPILAAGLIAAGACAEADSSDAGAAEATEAVQQTPEPTASCYLARGTVEEAADRPSPLGQTAIPIGDAAGLICYGRPSLRGREILGVMEPFGRPWRSGANEATGLHLPFAARVGTIELQPGNYSLYTIPNDGDWEIVINANHERWGIPISDEVRAQDIGSFMSSPSVLETPVETLTYVWEPGTGMSGNLVLEWETTRVEIPVERLGG